MRSKYCNCVRHVISILFKMALALSLIKGENGCRNFDFLGCQANMTLKDHVIKSVRVPSLGKSDCQHQCFMEKECKSYNLGKILGKLRTCELNDADSLSYPSDLVTSEGSEYCPIKNPCASNPCPDKKVCQPDFYWNTYNCTDGKWSQWGTWSDCRCFNQTRSRICKKPDTDERAIDCKGKDEQRRKCQHEKACFVPLGMEDGRISDDQITASSYYELDPSCQPKNGRLNNDGIKAWCAGKARAGEYLQVDLRSVQNIYKVATQGRSQGQYVTKYKLSSSNDGENWKPYSDKIISANQDRSSIVEFDLGNQTIRSRYVRITVVDYNSYPSMRVEFYTRI